MTHASFRRWPVVAGAAFVLLAAMPSLAAVTRAHPVVALAVPHAKSSPVTMYHNDPYRSGQYVFADLTLKNAPHMRLVRTFKGPVNGAVYAQPLYWRPPNDDGAGEVI